MVFAHPALFMTGLIMVGLCMLTLAVIADARGQSKLHAVWGLLGLPGLAIGLLIMLALPSQPPARAS
jgi:hypothetical protein